MELAWMIGAGWAEELRAVVGGGAWMRAKHADLAGISHSKAVPADCGFLPIEIVAGMCVAEENSEIVSKILTIVVASVHRHGERALLHVVGAGDLACLFARLAQRGQQHCGKDGDDCDYDKQFNQCEL